MKRSDILTLIMKSVTGLVPNDAAVAEWILSDLEEAGMLPPTYTLNTLQHPEIRSYDIDGKADWEPETFLPIGNQTPLGPVTLKNRLIRVDLGENASRNYKNNLFEDSHE